MFNCVNVKFLLFYWSERNKKNVQTQFTDKVSRQLILGAPTESN